MKKHFILFLIFCCTSLSLLFGDENIARKKKHHKKKTIENPYIQNHPSLPYERFISIGNTCLTRFQINYHLEERFGLPVESFGGGHLFDWVQVRDYNLLAKTLENNLEFYFEKSDLSYDCSEHYHQVYNKTNMIYWTHLFSRNFDYFTLPYDVIEIEYELRKQKIDYLVYKFRELKNYRTLYIMSEEKPHFFLNPDELKEFLTRIRNALTSIRGNRNFTLLFCCLDPSFKQEIHPYFTQEVVDFENICIRILKRQPYSPVTERDSLSWDPILYEFPFTLEKIDWDNSGLDYTLHA